MPLPTYDMLFTRVIEALRELGGSASISELNDLVISRLALSPLDVGAPHGDGRQTELEYRLAWSRSYLKASGLVNNPRRAVWALTQQGQQTVRVDRNTVVNHLRSKHRGHPRKNTPQVEIELDEAKIEERWRSELLEALLQMSPSGFERLSQRLLRESGFTQVTVTGRSGDGGIDGTGIVQLGGLLSFPVLFQCKRYRGSVSAGAIRDFRGAMVGRTDRGLIITTGTFTREAKQEATRDGAPLIDLVDGEQLLDKLKGLSLGVSTTLKTVEDVTVVHGFFEGM
jgi:restriction system protein